MNGRSAGLRPFALLALALALSCAGGTPAPKSAPVEGPLPPRVVTVPVQPAPRPHTPAARQPAPAAQAQAQTAAEPSAPRLIRVGLATDLHSVRLPCCDAEVSAEADGRTIATLGPVVVRPAAGATPEVVYRVQVAALKDEGQAKGLAQRLRARFAVPGGVVFDAGSDLYRVRIGGFKDRAAAESEQRHLAALGLVDTWVVSESAGKMVNPALLLERHGKETRVPGRWLEVRAVGSQGIRVDGGRYRGVILIYLNDRGTLNVINELPVEDYLRGVVPSEMGPATYNQIEALKAQAVAARTYTLRNLGEFSEEGYDICATPRCQVYGGMDAEQPLTDKAVRETAGQVLVYHGQLIDALYSSTCGGHTEDVQVVFPLKTDEPYLKGVPCVEAGVDRLAGDQASGRSFEETLLDRLLPVRAEGERQVLAARLRALAALAGLPPSHDHLISLRRREVQRFVSSLFDLALDSRLFVANADLEYLLDHPPSDWGKKDLRLAAYLVKSDLLDGQLGTPLSKRELDQMVIQLALYVRVLKEERGTYLGMGQGALELRQGTKSASFAIPGHLATFRRYHGPPTASTLSLLPGDPLALYSTAGRLLAVVQTVNPNGASFDRTSHVGSWTRFRSDQELTSLVDERYPGLGFKSFKILSRGVSGRVGRLELFGDRGRSVEIDGLAIRWTFQLPDTLFTAKRLAPAHGAHGWLFTGRGWGHGVGLCQIGSYGMALRGRNYKEILHHYYTGVELTQVHWTDR